MINLLVCESLYSMGIESVVHQSSGKVSSGIRDAMCPACEMAVVWMQNQLKQNQTQDRILNYVNEVQYT
jgi:phytepsin